MAILIPSIDQALRSKQKPTEGEIFLLNFLENHFEDDVEVHFQPCLNGDRPDVVLISRERGVIIIEVKDWNLDLYKVDDNNQWFVNTSSKFQSVKSPFEQVFAYKKNFFDIHVNGLLEKSLKNKNFYKIIKTYVYFHNGSEDSIHTLYKDHLDELDERSRTNGQKFKSKKIDFDRYTTSKNWIDRQKYKFERNLSYSRHKTILDKINFPDIAKNQLFDKAVYDEFKRLLNPPRHYASEGRDISYSDKQSRLIESTSKARAKICGLAGSGKTIVLAGRAVNAHKRHGDRVLILTFNITLGSYIRDKISAVREDFNWGNFEISTYHRFITTAMNNSGINFRIPQDLQYEGYDAAVARRIALERDKYLEETYYSNLNLFESKDIGSRYDTILIDEIQDYKSEWIKIIRSFFLADDGEMVLFGDEKQNIYKRALDGERRSKVAEGFGSWIKLTKSFRYTYQSPIIPLIDSFQKKFLLNNYELDEDESFQLSLTSIGIQAYSIFDRADLEWLAKQIFNLAKKNAIHPNDITIISSQETILQNLDYVLRTAENHKERTLCAFPSLEVSKHPKYSTSYQKISTAKKIGFNLNSGVMKLSSTHSFKGFESPLIVLLVNNSDSPEMVFTGLTRAKENLVVYLEKNSLYSNFFETHLAKIADTSSSDIAMNYEEIGQSK